MPARPALSRLAPPSHTIVKAMANGRNWHMLDPSPMDVDFRAIAAQLAKLCRFDGACHSFYSVAQHSVHVAEQLPPGLRLYGLLHDAHEAMIGDITTPVREAFATLAGPHALRTLVDLQDGAIHAAAGLPWPPTEADARAIYEADRRLFATEWRDLMPANAPAPALPCRPMGTRIRPWPWPKAEERFLATLNDYLPAHLRRPA